MLYLTRDNKLLETLIYMQSEQ